MKKYVSVFLGFILAVAIYPTNIPAQQPAPSAGTCVQLTGASLSCAYSPTQLGANAVTLPASSSTALTNIIDMRGAKSATLVSICTQIVNIQITFYAEDGATAAGGPYSAMTNVAAAGNSMHIGSESSIISAGGTASIVGITLPQRALAFDWNNTTATAGTCTARLFVQY